ncbi:MAG: hypothetical protein R3Y32_04210 [Bacillota bacterium]
MANLASLTSFKEGDRRKVIRNGSRFEHWKMLFLGGFNSMFVLNLIALLALMPVILVGYNYFSTIWETASVLPFASSVGTGIITVVDTASIQYITTQQILLENMIYVPLAIFASSVLIAPFFYAIRNAEYDGSVTSYTGAIQGYKFCALKFAVLGVITALICELAIVAYYFYNTLVFNGLGTVASVAYLIGLAAYLFFALTIMIYAYILTVTYKMSIGGALKRAVVFTFTLPLQNLCITIATIAPIALAFINSFVLSLVVTLYIFVGFSYMLSIWMVYVQTILTIATPQAAKKSKK